MGRVKRRVRLTSSPRQGTMFDTYLLPMGKAFSASKSPWMFNNLFNQGVGLLGRPNMLWQSNITLQHHHLLMITLFFSSCGVM